VCDHSLHQHVVRLSSSLAPLGMTLLPCTRVKSVLDRATILDRINIDSKGNIIDFFFVKLIEHRRWSNADPHCKVFILI
jgi:hypothetical protein